MQTNVHGGQPVACAGEALETAQAAMVMIHGRGASAESILELAAEFRTRGVAFLAPQAAGGAWYPQRFLAPIAANEPYLTAALDTIGALLAQIAAAGIPAKHTFLLGFSQGACLALSYVAQHPQRYGGVFGLSGGLIGPPETRFEYGGSLEETPVFLGCSDVDFHIPLWRVRESTEAFRRLGGNVTERIYPGMGHTVNEDEIAFVQAALA